MNQTKPLTNEEIREVYTQAQKKTFEKWKQGIETNTIREFAKGIEEWHGIK